MLLYIYDQGSKVNAYYYIMENDVCFFVLFFIEKGKWSKYHTQFLLNSNKLCHNYLLFRFKIGQNCLSK